MYVNNEVNLVAFLQTVVTFAPAICIWASSGLFIPSWGRRNLMLKGFTQKMCTPLLLYVLVVFHLSSRIALFLPASSCSLHLLHRVIVANAVQVSSHFSNANTELVLPFVSRCSRKNVLVSPADYPQPLCQRAYKHPHFL